MRYIECPNGHVFDADLHMNCPYCSHGGTMNVFGTQNMSATSSNVGKTVAAVNFGAPNNGGMSEIGSTVAPSNYMHQGNASDTGKTVGVMAKSMNTEPVVGWLVCIAGPNMGKDYRILAKNNSVGRSDNMDICIKGDNTISRENHARISYDEKHNNFYLIPADSTNNIYLDDEPVFIPTKLEERKIIEFGESQFYFVSLCGAKFNWKEGLK